MNIPPQDRFTETVVFIMKVCYTLIGLFVVWAGWSLFSAFNNEEGRVERARELDAFIERRAEKDATRERNKIIYDEMTRQQVRQGN